MDLHSITARSNAKHIDIEGQREETPLDGNQRPDPVNVNGKRRDGGSNVDTVMDLHVAIEMPSSYEVKLSEDSDIYTDELFNLLYKKKCEFKSTFEERSKADGFNVNCTDGWSTYLQLACWAGNVEVVECLLDNGADLNMIGNNHSYPPIMEAGRRGHLDIIQLIVDKKGHREQLIAEHRGVNVLHMIIDGAKDDRGSGKNYEQCLEYVLKMLKKHYSSRYRNIVNFEHKDLGTPLEYAQFIGNEMLIEILVNYGGRKGINYNERSFSFDGKYCDVYTCVSENIPIEGLDRPQVKVVNKKQDTCSDHLANMLLDGKFYQFINEFHGKPDVYIRKELSTCLQVACTSGQEEASRFLLDSGADLNLTGHIGINPCIMRAGLYGHLNIIKLIIDKGHTEQLVINHRRTNLLHEIVRIPQNSNSDLIQRKIDCLKYVLEMLKKHYPSHYRLIVNEANPEFGTPLQLAAYAKQPEMVSELLNHGARMFVKGKDEKMVFYHIDATIFEKFFETCMSYGNQSSIDTLTFNYEFMAVEDACSETEPLVHLSRSPDHRHLLKHPVFTTFFKIKWKELNRFYWFNVWFHLTLTCFLIVYLSNDKSTILDNVFCCFMSVRLFVALWQITVLGRNYFLHFHNWLEIALFIITPVIFKHSMLAIFILFTQLMLWIFIHPKQFLNGENIHAFLINQLLRFLVVNFRQKIIKTVENLLVANSVYFMYTVEKMMDGKLIKRYLKFRTVNVFEEAKGRYSYYHIKFTKNKKGNWVYYSLDNIRVKFTPPKKSSDVATQISNLKDTITQTKQMWNFLEKHISDR